MPIVANANEQAPAVGVGKSRYRLRQLTSISHTVFEVLLLMLALTNQAQKIFLVVHTSCEGTKKRAKKQFFAKFFVTLHADAKKII